MSDVSRSKVYLPVPLRYDHRHPPTKTRPGLSQAKFAALMSISVATLRNWEQGRRRPEGSAKVLLRVVAK